MGKCLTWYLQPNLSNLTVVIMFSHKLKYHQHNLDMALWHATPVRFIGMEKECGMAYVRQCFQVDTTWVPSKASISTLQAGNAPVAPLVLHGVERGGYHLPSGDPFALYFPF